MPKEYFIFDQKNDQKPREKNQKLNLERNFQFCSGDNLFRAEKNFSFFHQKMKENLRKNIFPKTKWFFPLDIEKKFKKKRARVFFFFIDFFKNHSSKKKELIFPLQKGNCFGEKTTKTFFSLFKKRSEHFFRKNEKQKKA
jgi:hypothetical protein